MAVIQLNPVGMVSTDEGFISSISVRNNGGSSVLTPDANGQVVCSALAATRLCGGTGNQQGSPGQHIKLVTG